MDRPSSYEDGTYRVLQTCAVIRLEEVEIYGSGKDVFGFRLQKRGGGRGRETTGSKTGRIRLQTGGLQTIACKDPKTA